MSSSLSPKGITVTKCPLIVRTNMFKINNSLPIVDDNTSLQGTAILCHYLSRQLKV